MKIISNKKFEEMNQTLIDLQLELNDLQGNYDAKIEQVAYLQNEIKKLQENVEQYSTALNFHKILLQKEKKDTKKLKTLLTKNKIDYKSILEKSDKNVTKTTNKTRKTTRKIK